MKRILMFVLLFAALKVAGQTTGYLRFDTVKIMKQNGYCELYIINKTKDSLGLLTNVGGGLTQFRKSKMLNDSTIIIGLDTLLVRGAGSGSSGSATLSNVGSGYRLVKTADGQVKTVFAGYGIIADSTTNTNALTFGADTSSTNHVVTQSDLNDVTPLFPEHRVPYYNSSNRQTTESAFTYNATTNKLSADSADHIQARADSFFIRNQAQYLKPDTANILGDSHFVGQGASVTDSACPYIESAALDVIPVSLAVSGTGATSTANRFLINKNPGNTTAALGMIGFNDPRRNGLPRKTLNKIINSHKSIFANQYLKSYTNAGTGGTGVTRSGSWVNSWDASAEGGKTTVGAYTSTTNDYIEYAFTDSTVIVGLMPGDGSASSYIGSDVDVSIDGAFVETINTNNQTDGVADGSGLDNKRCAMALIYTGLTNAAHTIRLTKKATGGGGFMIMDYFGHLVDRSQAQLMLWHHIPKMTAAGYATSPANATDATTDTVNAKIDSLKATYPISLYPTYVVPTNTVYDPNVDADPDGIHMADAGHRKIADLALNVTLNDVVPAPGVDGAIYYDNEYKGVINGLKETFLMRRAADSRYIRNQNYFTQTADYKISGTGTADRFVTTGSVFSGSIVNADRQANGIAGGIAVGGPVLSIRNNSGATNARTWDWFVGSDAMEQRVLSDNLAVAPYIIRVKVSSTPLIDSIKMPKLHILGNLNVDGTATVADDAYDATNWNGNLTVPTKNAVRDKIESLGGGDGNGIYTGSGSLSGATTITGAGNALTMTGTQGSTAAFNVNNTGNGTAIAGTTTGTGSAATFSNSSSGNGATISNSSTGNALNATSVSGLPIKFKATPSSTNTIVTTLRGTRGSSGTMAIGGGNAWDMQLTDDAGNDITTAQFRTVFTDATTASPDADFHIWTMTGGSSSQKFTIKPTGQLNFLYYGSGTFTGTLASYLVTTSGGDVVEQAASTIPVISTGTAAPGTTPGKVGDIYIDTNNKKLYFATGTSSSADWTIAN